MTPDIYTVPGSHVAMAIADVPDTTNVITEPSGALITRAVPGYAKQRYVPWGADDQLPYDLIDLVGADEVTAQNKLFNVLTCYAAGLRLESRDEQALAWWRRQSMPSWYLEQITDMKYFYFTLTVIILSRDGTRINRIVHKEACHCRFAPQNARTGWPDAVYYANWRDGQALPGTVERIPLLDPVDPLGDLLRRQGYDDERKLTRRGRIDTARKYALWQRFPTPGATYYPIPYWGAMLRGGSYDEKRLISTAKRAMLRNHTSIKYLVEVEHGYWARICREEGITDPVEQRERVRREKENIRDFVAGLDNAGKVWISAYYTTPDGQEVHDVKISTIQGGKEGGDWDDDIQAAANTVCYADNIHPNLVGATPGKSQMNNSGSDKRELFTMKQALETAFHDIILRPLTVVSAYNQWRATRIDTPLIELTTLDTHRDARLSTTNA